MYGKNNNAGFALIDAIIGMTITALLISAFLGSIYQADRVSATARERVVASHIMLETYETATAIAKTDFSAIVTAYNSTGCATGPCHFEVQSGSWVIQSGSSTQSSRYETGFTLHSVSRDSSTDDIDSSSGVIDGNTFQMRITVAWNNRGATTTDSLNSYLYNLSP